MPTYDYECDKCEGRFETYQSFSEDALKKCPKDLCLMETHGKGKVRRVYSAPGISFKGSGFYKTDSRTSSGSSSNGSTSSSKSSSDSSSGASDSTESTSSTSSTSSSSTDSD